MKSNVSDFLKLVRCIYRDATVLCTADVSDLRDLTTVESRVKDEGLSFLTITLPNFCRDFERSLAEGQIDSKYFQGFRKYQAIPCLFRGMLSRIFDVETGRIYDDKNIASSDVPSIVSCVRQICLTFKKIEMECTPKRKSAALENYIAIERSFNEFSLQEHDRAFFDRTACVLWDSMLHTLSCDMFTPKHGPGATADYISGNQKYVWVRWHERLEPFFPFLGTGYSLSSYQSKEFEDVTFVPEDQEQPVRVVFVPKTLKGPRVIAIEPHCMQYTQQGIQSLLRDTIESNWLTSGHINFRDQSINQSLALTSSKTGLLATIDLSDASDRVPLDLALGLFRSNPDLMDAIDACRSTHASLPNGTIIGPLNKFASMGSALCFPVESMYFYTICVVALLRSQNLPVSVRNVRSAASRIFVYGDDIVVPSEHAVAVLENLQKYNCKVNHNKSFWTGKFRESCGVDAYDGELVTPIYVGTLRPKNRQQVSSLISWVATANLFYKKGYWMTASHMFDCVEKILGPLPFVSEESPILGRISFLGRRSIGRWRSRPIIPIDSLRLLLFNGEKSLEELNKMYQDYQTPEIRGWMPEPVYQHDELDGYGALGKSLLKLRDLKNLSDSRDAHHLEHSALHGAVALKLRWVPVT